MAGTGAHNGSGGVNDLVVLAEPTSAVGSAAYYLQALSQAAPMA